MSEIAPSTHYQGHAAETLVMHDEALQQLNDALMSLTKRQRKVVALRFGLLGKSLTQPEIAEVLDISTPAVCRLERAALDKLKEGLWDYCGDDGLRAFLLDEAA